MTDFTLKATLVGDASALNAALRQGAQGVDATADKVVQANNEIAASAKKAERSQQEAGASLRAVTAGHNAALAAQQGAMRRARAESNQLREAYRQLPMQITDVTTSLVSGMPIWMVAIQQGGQIKDSFGGIVPAARGVLSLLTPLRLAVGGAAGAFAGLAMAVKQASDENDAYVRAIVMSGNAAGVTAGQLGAMARGVSAVIGTEGAAAETLAMLAASGRVAASNMEAVTVAALAMERELGVAVGDTVAEFEALGKKPLQAAVQLNERYRFLTVAVYDQIKALMDQGRVAEAGELAQQQLASVQTQRMEELEGRIGGISQMLRTSTQWAKGWWDALVGGARGGEQRELDSLNERIALLTVKRDRNDGRTGARLAGAVRELEEERDAILAVIAAQDERAKAEKKVADEVEARIAGEAKREAAAKAAEAAQKASAAAYKQVADSIAQRLAAAQAELAVGGQLTAAEQLIVDVKRRVAEASDKISAAAGRRLLASAQEAAQAVAAAEAQARLAQSYEAVLDARIATGNAAIKEGDDLAAANERLREEIETLGLKGDALFAVEQARISSAIATRESTLAELEASGQTTRQTEGLRAQIEALKELQTLRQTQRNRTVQLEAQAEVEQARQREQAENERRSDALAESISDGILEGVRSGESIMKVFGRELEAQFARIVLQPMVKPIAEAGNKLIEQLLNAGMAYLTGGSTATNVNNSAGNSWIDPGIMANVGHTGGVVGVERMDGTRRVPASLFAGAPRYHRGMLAPDEYPAVLQKGESVLTPAQMRQVAGAGSGVTVNVINQTSQPVQASAQRNGDGSIEVVLSAAEEFMADRLASGTGPLHGAMQQRFGVRSTFNS